MHQPADRDDFDAFYRGTVARSPRYAYAMSGTAVNIDVTVTDHEQTGEWSVPVERRDATRWCAAGADAVPTVNFDLGRHPTVTDNGNDPASLPTW